MNGIVRAQSVVLAPCRRGVKSRHLSGSRKRALASSFESFSSTKERSACRPQHQSTWSPAGSAAEPCSQPTHSEVEIDRGARRLARVVNERSDREKQNVGVELDTPRRVLSGIQPTGTPHLGNYLGALINWVQLQPKSKHDYASDSDGGSNGNIIVNKNNTNDDNNNTNKINKDRLSIVEDSMGAIDYSDQVDQVFYSVVDLHAITVAYDPATLRSNSREMAAALLGCGVDPSRSVIFRQSEVPYHTELTWLLSCVTPLGWLKRMTQFKQKAEKSREQAALGLLSYPVLMAADILVYRATSVPVGEDQVQHLELTRDIAAAFNDRFKPQRKLPIPRPIHQTVCETHSRVMSLRDGRAKMSKSDPSDLSRIGLTDSADIIQKKIRKAKSDLIPEISYDPEERPEVANLLRIFAALTQKDVEQVTEQFQGRMMSEFKKELTEVVVESVCPIGEKILAFQQDELYIDQVLRDGAAAASEVAAETVREVKEAMGY